MRSLNSVSENANNKWLTEKIEESDQFGSNRIKSRSYHQQKWKNRANVVSDLVEKQKAQESESERAKSG